jgi:hypothetical protein
MHHDPLLQEHDPFLSPNLTLARRFLEGVWPSPGGSEIWQSNSKYDEAPRKRSSHTIHVRDDAIIALRPRADERLYKRLVGPFDGDGGVGKVAAEFNIANRVGILVEFSSSVALIAHYAGQPEHGRGARVHAHESLPLEPVRLTTGPNGHETWIWLLQGDDKLSQADREASGKVLAERHGAAIVLTEKALVRLPGFYNRQGRPYQVGWGYTGHPMPRYTADRLRQAFLGVSQEAVIEEQVRTRIPVNELPADIDTKVTPAIVAQVRMPLADQPHVQLGLLKAFPVTPSFITVSPPTVHLLWLSDAPISEAQHKRIANRLQAFGVDVVPRGAKVSLPKDGRRLGAYDEHATAGVHQLGDLVNVLAG